MSRAVRAMLFVLLALVAGNDFLLQPPPALDHDGFAAKHRPAVALLTVSPDDDGDEHLHPVPTGGSLGGALLVLLALSLPEPGVGDALAPAPTDPPVVSAQLRLPEPRGPPPQRVRA